MELSVNSMPRSESHHKDRHSIVACNDLPTFCKLLVAHEDRDHRLRDRGDSLLLTELWIIIGDEVGTIGGQSEGLETHTIGHPKELLTAAMKNDTACHVFADETSGAVDESKGLSCQYMKGNRRLGVNRIEAAKSGCAQRPTYVDNSRLQSLLEPLRLLYNVGNVYIDAPISGQYWLEIFTTMSGAQPKSHVLFAAVFTALDEAIAIYESGDMAFAIPKLKWVIDTMKDTWEHCGKEVHSTVVMTGRYTGLMHWFAFRKMTCLIWDKLARASLTFSKDPQQVRTAWKLTQEISHECRCYYLGCKDEEAEHDNVYLLMTMVWEALDQLGEYNDVPRSHALLVIVRSLRFAVSQEPDNAMLEKEFQRKLKEMEEAERLEGIRKTESDKGI